MNERQEPRLPPDPLIDEIRAIRKAVSERFNNDVGALCEYLRELDAQHPEKIGRPKPPNASRCRD